MKKKQSLKNFFYTEVLPEERSILFTNKPFVKLINSNKFDLKIFDKERFFETIPLEIKVRKGNVETRSISIPNPLGQIYMLLYYLKYEYLILNFLKKSNYSVRKPIKLNMTSINLDTRRDKFLKKFEEQYNLKKEETISSDELEVVYETYYAYSYVKRITSLYSHPKFNNAKMKYRYFKKLDIENFFNSIYTHSLSWAIFGDKNLSKLNKSNNKSDFFANATDKICQIINKNETNGIVVGPEFSRVIAEILLTDIDQKIFEILYNNGLALDKNYKIFRYVDDYFIFSNSKSEIEFIELTLRNQLSTFNLRLNNQKSILQERPFKLNNTGIISLKSAHSDFLLEKYLSFKISNINYSFEFKDMIGRNNQWKKLSERVEDIITNNKDNKKSIVLYFLKAIDIPVPKDSEISNASLKVLVNAIETIMNIYAMHMDFYTTEALLFSLSEFINKFPKNSTSYNKICDKIFNFLYAILKNHSDMAEECYDILIFLKFLPKKMNSQFLCELLKNTNNYFLLCSIAFYISNDDSIDKRYSIVLKKLDSKIRNILNNYETYIDNKLFDSNFFFIAHDFYNYRPLKNDKIKKIYIREADKISDEGLKDLFKGVMLDISFFDWDASEITFKRRSLEKRIISSSQRSNRLY